MSVIQDLYEKVSVPPLLWILQCLHFPSVNGCPWFLYNGLEDPHDLSLCLLWECVPFAFHFPLTLSAPSISASLLFFKYTGHMPTSRCLPRRFQMPCKFSLCGYILLPLPSNPAPKPTLSILLKMTVPTPVLLSPLRPALILFYHTYSQHTIKFNYYYIYSLFYLCVPLNPY